MRALLRAPLGPGLRTSRGCGQAAGLLFEGERRTCGRLALDWGQCAAGASLPVPVRPSRMPGRRNRRRARGSRRPPSPAPGRRARSHGSPKNCFTIDSCGIAVTGAVDDEPDMAGARARMRSCPQPAGRSGRWLRAAVFTLLSSALAVVAHRLASEDPVSWWRATVGAPAVFALSWPAARPSLPGRHVLAATGLAQLLLHGALSLQRDVRHGHAAAHDGVLLETGHTPHHAAWAMTAAHCVATCLMALLMYRADEVLSRLPETVGRWAQAAVALAVATFGAGRRPWFRPGLRAVPGALGGLALRPAVMTMLCHAVVRRGPPAGRAGDVPLILADSSPAG